MFALRRRTDLLLALVDLGSAALVSFIAYVLRFDGVYVSNYYIARYCAMTVGLGVGWVLAGRAAGLYRRGALRPGETNTEQAVEAAFVVGVAVLVDNAVVMHGTLSRAWIGLVTLGLLVFGIATRGLIRRLRRALVPIGIGLERYAVVGDDAAGRRLLGDLTRAAGAPFVVVGVLPAGLNAEELVSRARELGLDGLIFPAESELLEAGRLTSALSAAGIDVLIAPGLLGLELRVASVAMLHGVPLLRAAALTPRVRAIRSRPRAMGHGVAILGTRGIPANYGGFETFAERLALRLVEQGVAVTVYCRTKYATAGTEWRGVRLVTLPTIANKYLDTVVHTFLSVGHLITRTRIRNVILCNAANAPALPLLRVAGRRTLINVDGLEWRRGKWGIAGRAWYRMGEWLSVHWASVLVTDAEEVRTYYRVRYDADSVMIPYGADLLPRGLPLPENLSVQPDRFVLYVSRWERENNPVMVARAHAASGTRHGLVMLGEATYDPELERSVRAAAAPEAVLPGAVFGDGYRALQSNARCYVHATEVGGTHPALIEAMGAGNLCLVLDTPENREVAGPDAWYFADEAELTELLRRTAALRSPELRRLRGLSAKRAEEHYSWATVAQQYLSLLADHGDPQARVKAVNP
jgi:glycosyltransferase involved in cell wall biosynthesis